MKRMSNIIIFQLIALLCLVSCDKNYKAGLKILNATERDAQVVSIEIDGNHISISPFSIPAGTAQKYSPIGHVQGVSLTGGERIAITIVHSGQRVKTYCTVTKDLEGNCLVQARFDGSSNLNCWSDCETNISN